MECEAVDLRGLLHMDVVGDNNVLTNTLTGQKHFLKGTCYELVFNEEGDDAAIILNDDVDEAAAVIPLETCLK